MVGASSAGIRVWGAGLVGGFGLRGFSFRSRV